MTHGVVGPIGYKEVAVSVHRDAKRSVEPRIGGGDTGLHVTGGVRSVVASSWKPVALDGQSRRTFDPEGMTVRAGGEGTTATGA